MKPWWQGLLFTAGILAACNEGSWFPYVNILGVVGIVFLVAWLRGGERYASTKDICKW